MKQDDRTGLWVPDSYRDDRPNFPPRLKQFDDTKPPTRLEGVSEDRSGVSTGWGDDIFKTRAKQCRT